MLSWSYENLRSAERSGARLGGESSLTQVGVAR